MIMILLHCTGIGHLFMPKVTLVGDDTHIHVWTSLYITLSHSTVICAEIPIANLVVRCFEMVMVEVVGHVWLMNVYSSKSYAMYDHLFQVQHLHRIELLNYLVLIEAVAQAANTLSIGSSLMASPTELFRCSIPPAGALSISTSTPPTHYVIT